MLPSFVVIPPDFFQQGDAADSCQDGYRGSAVRHIPGGQRGVIAVYHQRMTLDIENWVGGGLSINRRGLGIRGAILGIYQPGQPAHHRLCAKVQLAGVIHLVPGE